MSGWQRIALLVVGIYLIFSGGGVPVPPDPKPPIPAPDDWESLTAREAFEYAFSNQSKQVTKGYASAYTGFASTIERSSAGPIALMEQFAAVVEREKLPFVEHASKGFDKLLGPFASMESFPDPAQRGAFAAGFKEIGGILDEIARAK